MAELIEHLDSKVLLYVGSGISFINSAFVAPVYNFPLYLFSIYAYERENNSDSLRYATGMMAVSLVLDFIWLLKTSGQNGFNKAFSIILLVLKAPTVLAMINLLRTRGSGIGFGETGSLSGGNTIWSMPGGFGSGGGGYQAVGGDRDDDIEQARPAPPPRQPPTPNTPRPTGPVNTGP